MAQLKMYWFPGTGIKEYELPEGYSFSNYKDEKDIDAWVEICRNGLVGDGEAGYENYKSAILGRPDIVPERDMFFLDYNGEHIGTITAYVHSEDNTGDVHMVSIRTDYRGKGLAKYLNMKALQHLSQFDITHAHLTTDEWRKGAIKGYLNAGFLPVEYDEGMEERWLAVFEDMKIDGKYQMVNDDCTPYKMLENNA